MFDSFLNTSQSRVVFLTATLSDINRFKVSKDGYKTRREICSKLALYIPEPHFWYPSGEVRNNIKGYLRYKSFYQKFFYLKKK